MNGEGEGVSGVAQIAIWPREKEEQNRGDQSDDEQHRA